MLGLMQDRELLISSLLVHAETYHPRAEVVSQLVEGGRARHDWGALGPRIRRLANALRALGVRAGSVVATLAWNTHRHLELYFGVSGLGAVLHTVNPRLYEAQIEYIINHAQDEVLCFDATFTALIEKLRPRLPTVRHFIALSACDGALPLDRALPYEELLAAAADAFEWPRFDERTASSLCYTSGTTGHPKGVLYSHRSTVLHTLAAALPDAFGIDAASVMVPFANMFHANAWGIPYIAALTGARLVLLGRHMEPAMIYAVLRDERATFAGGVPTVWTNLFAHIDAHGLDPRRDWCLRQAIFGGSAMPPASAARLVSLGIHPMQLWGMTETSPLGVANRPLPQHADWPAEQRLRMQCKQGRAVWGVELKLLGGSGETLPHDGKSFGRLLVRGPWVVQRYFRAEQDATDAKGWFDTGDVATIDPDGYLQIVDRAKDVIKSGGEWISSIEIENLVAGCPGVATAAVIGVRHPRWEERPLLIVVRSGNCEITKQHVLDFLRDKIVKWWMPDDVVFVAALPMTATGKISKLDLRKQYAEYLSRHGPW